MDAQLEAKFIECLDALAQGESVERILARYPDDTAQLRPLLRTAAGLPALRLEPSEAAKIKSRQQFMAQADLLRRTAPRKTMGFLPRFVTGFAAAAIVALVLSTGAVTASGSALPGDPLYGLKRTVEGVRLQSASSPTQRAELQREFEQRRVDEANELLDAGREGEVEFTGIIEEIQPNAWIVSSLVVQIDANTQIVGTPQINRVAEVRGVTGPNGLRASSISIESSGELEITPTPEATATPQANMTPEPTKTVAPTTTATPRPTATVRPTATPEPVEVEFSGTVNAIDAGAWIVDGTTVIINASTEIRDALTVGQRVKVRAMRFADGRLVATRLELSDDGGSGSNSNDNQNPNENQNGDDDNSNDGDGNSNDNGNTNGDDGNDNSGANDNSNSNDNDSNDNGD